MDYFQFRQNKWWRYSPGIGFEFDHVFGFNDKSETMLMGFGLTFGLVKPIDLYKGKLFNKKMIPVIGFKILFGNGFYYSNNSIQ